MAVAQAQYLRIFKDTTTFTRWQSYYVNANVSWQSATWTHVPFTADGFTAGISGDESSISIAAPATKPVVEAFEDAIREGRLVELLIYEFDPQDGDTSPQAGQALVGSYLGQVVGGGGGLTTLSVQLGSALAPVGSQVPPRVFTTQIMGPGCRL